MGSFLGGDTSQSEYWAEQLINKRKHGELITVSTSTNNTKGFGFNKYFDAFFGWSLKDSNIAEKMVEFSDLLFSKRKRFESEIK